MPYSLKPDDAAARERLRAFWSRGRLDRPCLGITAERPDWTWPSPFQPELTEKQRDLMPGYHAWRCAPANDRRFDLAEAFPYRDVNWGSWLMTLPVWAGADYEYHGSAWTRPIPDILDREPPAWDEAHPLLAALDACYDAARTACGGRALLAPPLMLDGLTTLAELRGPEALCLELLERPERVRRWASALTDAYIAIYERYFRRIGQGESVCFFGPLAEGRSEGVQCDFAVMCSPGMFADFVLPDLRRVTDYMDFSLYHLDGVAQMRFLDHLRSCPKLNGIQWNPEHDQGRPTLFLPQLKRIRDAGLALYVHCESVDEARRLITAIGPDALYINLPTFPDRALAEAAVLAIEHACRPTARSRQAIG